MTLVKVTNCHDRICTPWPNPATGDYGSIRSNPPSLTHIWSLKTDETSDGVLRIEEIPMQVPRFMRVARRFGQVGCKGGMRHHRELAVEGSHVELGSGKFG